MPRKPLADQPPAPQTAQPGVQVIRKCYVTPDGTMHDTYPAARKHMRVLGPDLAFREWYHANISPDWTADRTVDTILAAHRITRKKEPSQ